MADPPGTHDAGYLDAASSEPLHPAAAQALAAAAERAYADPRRTHRAGREARLVLDNAREAVAGCLGVRADEVTFAASGTHATHLGLLGLLRGRARVGRRLVVGAVEHSAVLHAARWHEDGGGTVSRVGVDRLGRVCPDELVAVARGGADEGPAAVVALQSANHEVGTLQPVAEVAAALESDGVPLFVDACSSVGRAPLPRGWAVAAASAHKWGGPAGVGVLLVRKGARWRAPYPADDRVEERGTGFENVPAALAAAAALQAATREQESLATRHHALVARIRERVAALPDVEVVGDPDERLPHLVTFSCLYLDGESLVGELDRHGFAVASGSACTSSTLEPSHVLAAMGALTHGNVRVSLTRRTDEATVERFLAVLPGVLSRLRAEAGL